MHTQAAVNIDAVGARAAQLCGSCTQPLANQHRALHPARLRATQTTGWLATMERVRCPALEIHIHKQDVAFASFGK